jgi:hypothetical protein
MVQISCEFCGHYIDQDSDRHHASLDELLDDGVDIEEAHQMVDEGYLLCPSCGFSVSD